MAKIGHHENIIRLLGVCMDRGNGPLFNYSIITTQFIELIASLGTQFGMSSIQDMTNAFPRILLINPFYYSTTVNRLVLGNPHLEITKYGHLLTFQITF